MKVFEMYPKVEAYGPSLALVLRPALHHAAVDGGTPQMNYLGCNWLSASQLLLLGHCFTLFAVRRECGLGFLPRCVWGLGTLLFLVWRALFC